MEGGLFKKKVGVGKVLHSQAREIVANVYEYMKQEKESGAAINVNKLLDRVQAATQVPVSSIKRIVSERKKIVTEGTEFNTPKNNQNRKNPQSDLDNFDLGVIRRTINEFHLVHKERPTIKTLLTVLKDKISFKGGEFTLRGILKKMKYRWRKTVNNRKILVEQLDIREKRLEYLRKIKEYRSQNRNIIYMDETYVHTTHMTPKGWSDDSNAGFRVPVSKGKRLIIVNAGNENGFVSNALLTFESGKKTGDYHKDMNFENYEKWLKNKLIPNISPNSVIVVDNAPYHNVQINKAPTSNSLKSDMLKWLTERNITFPADSLKPDLYKLIILHKPKYKMYKIDSILADHGHSVLRLPPYHPELNPIEMVWSLLKQRVAKKNILCSMEVIKKLVETTSSEITAQEWLSRVNHVKNTEETYMNLEPHIDTLTEAVIINLQDDSDSFSDGEESETNSNTSELDMSGIEPLQN